MLKALKTLFFGTTMQPTNHAEVVLGGMDPGGFRLLHAAPNVAEADMLRQVLIDAGFHMEHIPTANTGVFGTTGNHNIYALNAEYDAADAFLKEFLTADLLPEDQGASASTSEG